MLNSRSRRLTIALAAGSLTMFGAAGAFAAEDGGPPGGGDKGGSGPLCAPGTPMSATPLCPQPPGSQPAPGNPESSDEGGKGDGGGSNPLCSSTGVPVSLKATPLCAAPSQPPGEGGGGSPSFAPAEEGNPNPLCSVIAQAPGCMPKPPGEGGGGSQPGGGGEG